MVFWFSKRRNFREFENLKLIRKNSQKKLMNGFKDVVEKVNLAYLRAEDIFFEEVWCGTRLAFNKHYVKTRKSNEWFLRCWVERWFWDQNDSIQLILELRNKIKLQKESYNDKHIFQPIFFLHLGNKKNWREIKRWHTASYYAKLLDISGTFCKNFIEHLLRLVYSQKEQQSASIECAFFSFFIH